MKKNLLIPMNLQHFAENEDDDGTSSIELEVVDDPQPESEDLEVEDPKEDDTEEPEVEDDQVEVDPKEQSKDKNNKANSKFRELRLQAKKAKEVEEAQKALDQKYAKLAKEAGVEGVETAADYLAMVEKQIGVNKFKESNDPAALLDTMEQRIMDQVSGLVNQNTQQAEELTQEKLDLEFSKEFSSLNEQFGTEVEKLEDIAELPNSDTIIDAMDKGYDLVAAYKFANMDTIIEKQSKTAKQKAMNQIKGRSHVKAPGTGGNVETIKVTKGELDMFRQMYPGVSDNDLRKKIKSSRNYIER